MGKNTMRRYAMQVLKMYTHLFYRTFSYLNFYDLFFGNKQKKHDICHSI